MEEKTVQSEDFIVTARKFRPLRFHDVVGQDHVSDTLKNAIKSNRVHHAYLFCGPRGVGKTTSARIFARALNCKFPIDNEPCNKCDSCKSSLEERSMDIIEIDGASNNSVEDVRSIRENVKFPPSNGKYKIFVIDEVHMLSANAFNALLKTLEEPPPHLIFIFATTESEKVLPTIISRCLRFDFRRMEIDDIVKQLRYISKEQSVTIDEESLLTIAKKADGAMRDSQSIFDQAVAFCGKEINHSQLAKALNLIDEDFYFQVSEGIKNKDSEKMLLICEEVASKGYGILETIQGVLEHLRNIIAIKLCPQKKLVYVSDTYLKKYQEMAQYFNKKDLIRMMSLVNQAEQQIRWSPQPRIRLELVLLQLANLESSLEITQLVNEIRSIPNHSASLGADEKKKPELNKPALTPSVTQNIAPIQNAIKKPTAPIAQTPAPSIQAPSKPKPVQTPPAITIPQDISPAEKMLMEKLGAKPMS